MELQGLDRSLFMFPVEVVYNCFQRRHFLAKCLSRYKLKRRSINISDGFG